MKVQPLLSKISKLGAGAHPLLSVGHSIISVEAVKHNLIAMKADHIKGAVFFGKQNIESEGLRNHLSTLAKTLSRVRII
ncbi:eukaryotic translation initiation factor 3 subunit A-like isoform X2 [Ipomoea triloba]|uniref:eukaryotic translation initiation factor 3 subunit A-like isoform X2 n=1 Tax=Ipomoea triloba TaxID=35885 RepID=UPI00125D6204|nr:eukaryotic translation initiation factor 3 subunit A-like isoform X2 [Ipomoea triloba]